MVSFGYFVSFSEWQKLAKEFKGAVKIAYWDTSQGNPPRFLYILDVWKFEILLRGVFRLFGQIRGTPTIKFVFPNDKRNKKTSNKKKIISDYNGERKVCQ